MATSSTLSYVISVNANQAQAALQGLNINLNQTLTTTQNLQGGFSGLKANIITLNSAWDLLNKTTGAFKSVLEDTIGGIAEEGLRLEQLSARFQTSIKTISSLQFAAQQAGLGLDDFKQAARSLALALDQTAKPGSAAAIAFKAMGFSLQDIARFKKDPIGSLDEIGRAFNQYEDGANKATIATKFFRLGYGPMLALFAQGNDPIAKATALAKEFGLQLDDVQGHAMANMARSLGQITAAFVGLGYKIIAQPALLDALTNAFSSVAHAVARIGDLLKSELGDSLTQLVVKASKAVTDFLDSITARDIHSVVEDIRTFAGYMKTIYDFAMTPIGAGTVGALLGGAAGFIAAGPPGALIGAGLVGAASGGAAGFIQSQGGLGNARAATADFNAATSTTISDTLDEVDTIFGNFIKDSEGFFGDLKNTFETGTGEFQTGLGNLNKDVHDLGSDFKENSGGLIDAIQQTTKDFIQLYGPPVKEAAQKSAEAVKAAGENLSTNIQNLADAIGKLLPDFVKNLAPSDQTKGNIFDAFKVDANSGSAVLGGLLQRGFSANQAGGVAGNIAAESNFNTNATNSTSGAFGLLQWLGNRKKGLLTYAKLIGRDPSDLDVQLDYISLEKSGQSVQFGGSNESFNYAAALSGGNPASIALSFSKLVERASPADQAASATRRVGVATSSAQSLADSGFVGPPSPTGRPQAPSIAETIQAAQDAKKLSVIDDALKALTDQYGAYKDELDQINSGVLPKNLDLSAKIIAEDEKQRTSLLERAKASGVVGDALAAEDQKINDTIDAHEKLHVALEKTKQSAKETADELRKSTIVTTTLDAETRKVADVYEESTRPIDAISEKYAALDKKYIDLQRGLDNVTEALAKNGDEFTQQIADQQAANEATLAMAKANDEARLSVELLAKSYDEAFAQIESVVTDTFSGLILGTTKVKDVLKSLEASLLKTFINSGLESAKGGIFQLLTGQTLPNQGSQGFNLFNAVSSIPSLIGGLFGGGGGGGFLSGLFGGTSSSAGTGGLGILSSLLGVGGGSSGGSSGGSRGGGLLSLLSTGSSVIGGASTVSGLFGGPTIQGALSGLLGVGANTAFQAGGLFAGPVLTTAESTAAGLGGTAGTAAGLSTGASGLSSIVGYLAPAISLALAGHGLATDRASFDKLTLGASGSQGAKNALTGVGAGLIGGFTAGGAAAGSAVPIIGTLAGAAIGAAIGSALSSALSSSVEKGLSKSENKGLSQSQLETTVKKSVDSNILLNVFSLGATKAGVFDSILGSFVPNIENIFGKLLRQAIGGPGGFDTSNVPTEPGKGKAVTKNFGLGDLAGTAGQEGKIIAGLFGAGGQAFGKERQSDFTSIILGAVRKRIDQTGQDAGQVLAEVLVTAFHGSFLDAFKTQLEKPGTLVASKEANKALIIQQFQKTNNSLDFQTFGNILNQEGNIPGGRARKQARQATTDAIGSALSSGVAGDFETGISTSVSKAFSDAASSALASGPLGQLFAPLFSVSRDNRKKLRRAKRQGDTGSELDILGGEFDQDVSQIQQLFSGDSGKKILDTMTKLTTSVLQLQEAAALATGDFKAAADAELKLAQGAYAAGASQDVYNKFLQEYVANLKKDQDRTFQFQQLVLGAQGDSAGLGSLFQQHAAQNLNLGISPDEDLEKAAKFFADAAAKQFQLSVKLAADQGDYAAVAQDELTEALRRVRLGQGTGGLPKLAALASGVDAQENFTVQSEFLKATGDKSGLASLLSGEAVREFNVGLKQAAENLDVLAGATAQIADDDQLIHTIEQAKGRALATGQDPNRAAREIIQSQLDPALNNIRAVRSFGQSIAEQRAAFLPAGGTAAQRAVIAAGQAGIASARGDLAQAQRAGASPATILQLAQNYASLQFSSLTSQLNLAKSIKAQFEQVRDVFKQFSQDIDVIRRGPRAQADILAKDRAELTSLLPVATGPEGEDRDKALARLQQLIPEIENLGGTLLAPGSAAYQDLLTQLDTASKAVEDFATDQVATQTKAIDDVTTAVNALVADLQPIVDNLTVQANTDFDTLFKHLEDVLVGSGDATILGALRQIDASLTGDNVTQAVINTGTQSKDTGLTPVTGNPDLTVVNRANTAGQSIGVSLNVATGQGVTPEQVAVEVERALRARRPQLIAELRRAIQ